MPAGLNLIFPFDTGANQDPANTYPFSTGGGPGIPDPEPLGTLDAYHGIIGDYKFYTYTDRVFALCEYSTSQLQYNIIEFNWLCPDGIFWEGASVDFDLTVSEHTNVNLNLCDSPDYHLTIFEFEQACGLVNLAVESRLDFDLWTSGRQTGIRIDLPVCCEYEVPDPHQMDFFLGATEVRYNIETEGNTPYDFVFETSSPLIQETNYQLDVGGTPNADYFSLCDTYVIAASVCAVADLTTEPRDLLSNDFWLCPTSPQVTPRFEGLQTPIEPDTGDTNLPQFSFSSHYWLYEFTPKACNPGIWPIAHHDSQIDVELDVDKRTNWDFPICSEDLNPAPDYSENPNHVFEFKPDYIYECGAFEFVFYHGSNCYINILESIEIEGVFAFHGAYADASLSPFQNFSADARHGGYGNLDLTIFPSIELDVDCYYGHFADATLFTVVVFYDIDGYHGGTGAADLATFGPPTFEPNAYHGGNGEFEMLTEPNIQDVEGYHGSYGDLDFTSFPAALLEPNAYHGGNGVVDTIILTPQFEPVAYHGAYGDTDFTDVPSAGIGDVRVYHGGYGDVTMAVTLGLRDIEGYHGAYAEGTQLSFSTTFSVDYYQGAYADTDFTETPPPTFEPNVYHGGHAVLDDMAVTKALFPRAYAGAYANAGLQDFPAQELQIPNYHGGYAVVDALTEDEFNFFNYHGAFAEAEMAIQVNLGETNCYHGATSNLNDLNYEFVALDIDSYHGIRSIVTAVGFEVPPGPTILANAYGGEVFEATTDIREHAKLKVRFVHDLAMYDGFGGIGGLNHCYTTDLTYSSHYHPNDLDGPDHVIRFEYPINGDLNQYDSDLNFVFDEFGDRPWNVCNSHHNNGHMAIDLLTNPRFEAEAYHGHGTEVFMKKELTAFGEVPLDILYSENGEGGRRDHIDTGFTRDFFELDIYDGAAGAVWWEDDPDSIRAWGGYSCQVEFTLVPLAYEIVHDTNLVVDLGVPKPSWKEFIREFMDGAGIIMDFEPEIWFRFCPGYIVPVGNQVILEFASSDNTDCVAWYANGGERAEADLSCEYGLSVNYYHGSYAQATVTVQALWTLFARHGAHMAMASNVDFSAIFRHGTHIIGEFYEPPVYGYGGEVMELAELVVTGAAVEWVTPEGCLPNEYVPLTDGGDPDLAALLPDEFGVIYYVSVPVEGLPYFTPLNAQCITFAESEGGS